MLLHIEEQAMVQVVIKEVAAHLDMKDTSKINTVSEMGVACWEKCLVVGGIPMGS